MKKQSSKRRSIVIGGYYGYKNMGDEAVLHSILCSIAKKIPNARVFVLSSDKTHIPHSEGIEVIVKNRSNPFAIVSTFLRSQLFISGGGSLLQDKTSAKSLSYYCTLLHLAKLCGCKTFVFANGIGPLKNEKRCKSALCIADAVSVRDEDSLAFAEYLMDKKGHPVLSADPVFAHPFELKRTILSKGCSSIISGPYFVVSLRSCTDKRTPSKSALQKAFQSLCESGLTPVFVSMQDSFDLALSKEIASLVGGIVAPVRDLCELYCLLEKASFAVGMRLHFLLTAAMAGTPLVALSYDCKVESCVRGIGINHILDAFLADENDILRAVSSAKRDFSKTKTDEYCRNMRALALKDIDTAVSLLETATENDVTREKFYADT